MSAGLIIENVHGQVEAGRIGQQHLQAGGLITQKRLAHYLLLLADNQHRSRRTRQWNILLCKKINLRPFFCLGQLQRLPSGHESISAFTKFARGSGSIQLKFTAHNEHETLVNICRKNGAPSLIERYKKLREAGTHSW